MNYIMWRSTIKYIFLFIYLFIYLFLYIKLGREFLTFAIANLWFTITNVNRIEFEETVLFTEQTG